MSASAFSSEALGAGRAAAALEQPAIQTHGSHRAQSGATGAILQGGRRIACSGRRTLVVRRFDVRHESISKPADGLDEGWAEDRPELTNVLAQNAIADGNAVPHAGDELVAANQPARTLREVAENGKLPSPQPNLGRSPPQAAALHVQEKRGKGKHGVRSARAQSEDARAGHKNVVETPAAGTGEVSGSSPKLSDLRMDRRRRRRVGRSP